MIQTKTGWDDPSDDYTGTWDNTGFRYGMFEIRCKLPSEFSAPAFWLYGGATELDIFEAGLPNRISTAAIDWTTTPQTICQTLHEWDLPFDNFTSDFHTFTCVWTPDKITYFFDHRELGTITSIQTYPYNCALICNLAMYPWNDINTYMDIDYIRVYKPIGGNYSLPYKSSNDFVNTNVFENQITETKVSNIQNSIEVNPNNSNEIFFRGVSEDRIYKSVYLNGTWNTNIINYNYTPTMPASLCNGNLKYNPTFNYILYAGKDNRIQYFSNQGTNDWHWFIDDNWNSNENKISKTPNSMDVTNDGKIAYRGLDNKIHVFKWNANVSKWDQLTIEYTYGNCIGMPDADFVNGDVVVEKETNNIIYRGRDGRLQIFWQSSPFVYQHGWIDDNWGTNAYLVSTDPGSIVSTPKGVFYKGMDDKLHRFYWNGVDMIHQLPSYTYGLCAGMPDADFVKSNLSYLPSLNFVLYIGRDGRVQRFEIPSNNTSTSWNHYWIDDYWNTFDFLTFNATFPTSFASLVTSTDGKMIYNNERRNSVLSYFKLESCEILDLPCGSINEIRKMANPTSTETQSNIQNVSVYPNPSRNTIILICDKRYNPDLYEIYNMQGLCLLKKTPLVKESEIDISGLPKGMYIFRALSEKGIGYTKFIKQ
ncbi:MAG: T9SS type A sorting domain-containing protein [Chitinophagales bacterium]|jgi:hypothetical protein|nr:T9SS type A sorting domain-containing protein [Chitinophagales bacterium]MCC7058334.1 T9SS type A sorting domain-containing protein [Chitinophagales bacterium]